MADQQTRIRVTAVDETTKTLNSIRAGVQDLTGNFGKLSGALGALGVTGALAGLGAMVKGAIDGAAAMQELSQKTGIATKELTALDYAMRREGVSTEAFAKGMKELSKNLVEAGDSSSKASRLFQILGVQANAGPREALLKIADAFQALPDGVTKAALATELFTKVGTDLIPALNNGAKGIREIEEEAHKLGITFGTETGQAAKEFNDKMFALRESTKSLGLVLADRMLPSLNRIAGAMRDAAIEGGVLRAALIGLGGAFAESLGLNAEGAQRTREIREELARINKEIREAGLAGNIVQQAVIDRHQERIKQLGAELKLIEQANKARNQQGQSQFVGPPSPGQAELDRRLRQELASKGIADPARNLLVQLQLEYTKLTSLTKDNETVERVLAELKKDSYAKASQGLKDQAIAQAKLTDEMRKRLRIDQELAAHNQKELDAAAERGEAIQNLADGWEEATEQLRLELKLLGLTNRDREKAVLLEKARADIVAAGDSAAAIRDINKNLAEQLGLLDNIYDKQLEIKNTTGLWEDMADVAAGFFSDLVTQGRDAFDNLRRFVKGLLAEMVALFAKRWVLQMAGVAGGGTAGSDTMAGGLLNAAGSWLGKTAIGSYVSAALEGFQMGWQSGVAGPAAGYMERFGAAVSGATGALMMYTGIAAAVMANDRYFGQGWRADDQSRSNRLIGNVGMGLLPINEGDRILQALGFNDRWASMLSGSSLTARIWGHGPMRSDAYGIMGSIGPGGVTGQNWQDWSRQGGTFRSDIRGQETRPFDGSQGAFWARQMRGIGGVVGRLGDSLGVNTDTALAGYSRDFNMQLSENGERLSDERIAELFNDLFASVLQDQVALVLRAGGRGALADYVDELEGSGEAISGTIQAVLGIVDAIDGIDQAIAVLKGGPLEALKQQMRDMDKGVTDMQAAFDKALAGGDPEEILTAERNLARAVMDRYNAEIEMVRNLQVAIRQTEQSAYQFALNMGGRINAVGGSRDVAGIAMNRARGLRAGIGGNSPTNFQLEDLGEYVGAIDTWYNTRRDAIMRDAQAQADAQNAIFRAQAAAAQARVEALQKELDLSLAFQDLIDRTQQVLDDMRLSSMNPLPVTGRLALAGDDVVAARVRYQTSTGTDRADAANRLLEALIRQRDLGMEANDRPSAEWQELYNSIVAEISAIQEDARPLAERAVELQAQIVEAQQQANMYASRTADASQFASVALDALDKEARSYYEWAEAEGARLFGIQRQEQLDLLNAVTGGLEPNIFIAAKTKEAAEYLLTIRDALVGWTNNPGGRGAASSSGTSTGTSTGTGTGTGTGTSGAKAGVTINVYGLTPEDAIRKLATVVKREIANA